MCFHLLFGYLLYVFWSTIGTFMSPGLIFIKTNIYYFSTCYVKVTLMLSGKLLFLLFFRFLSVYIYIYIYKNFVMTDERFLKQTDFDLITSTEDPVVQAIHLRHLAFKVTYKSVCNLECYLL